LKSLHHKFEQVYNKDMTNQDCLQRCPWPGDDPLMQDYHDSEWGMPLHDESRHFEFLLLEFFQAGLSWRTILQKRENFRKAFAEFSPEKIASFSDREINRLLADSGIIRNKLKIYAAINNAARFLEVQAEHGSFDNYIWSFTNGEPIVNTWNKLDEIPVVTDLSDTISKDLKMKGFKFVGSTTMYAHLQAIGVVNDHLVSCFRHSECSTK
jgi:DNA-3-methyladenine glycosylase I